MNKQKMNQKKLIKLMRKQMNIIKAALKINKKQSKKNQVNLNNMKI